MCSPPILLSSFSFLWLLNELLQLRPDDRSPASLEVLPRIRGRLRKRFDSRVSELQSRLVALGEQFKRDERISRFAFVSPGISDLLLWNHLGDFAKVMITFAFVFDPKFESKPDVRFDFLRSKYHCRI